MEEEAWQKLNEKKSDIQNYTTGSLVNMTFLFTAGGTRQQTKPGFIMRQTSTSSLIQCVRY